MSGSAFRQHNFVLQIIGFFYFLIGAGSCVVNGGLAIYHSSMSSLLHAPVHIVAWPVYWTISVIRWEHPSQMILLWVACGIYVGIGCVSFVLSFFGHMLGGRGDLVSITAISLMHFILWPFFLRV